MEGHTRSSHRYLLLQVWCGLLTVAMAVMAAYLTSIKAKSSEDQVPTLKPDDVIPTAHTVMAPFKLTSNPGSSLSHIQLRTSDSNSWYVSDGCSSCSLALRSNSIYCNETGLYFIYAQVTFSHIQQNRTKSVLLNRNGRHSKVSSKPNKLVEGKYPKLTECSVWVASVASLKQGDSVSIDITGDFLKENTFWGAYQLH